MNFSLMTSQNFDNARINLMKTFNISLYEKLVDMLPRVNNALQDAILEEEPSQEVISLIYIHKVHFFPVILQEFLLFQKHCHKLGVNPSQSSSKLSEAMGAYGVDILRKILNMAQSTKQYASKAVSFITDEIAEQRKQLEESYKELSQKKRDLTTSKKHENVRDFTVKHKCKL